jgi:hypothetical protein
VPVDVARCAGEARLGSNLAKNASRTKNGNVSVAFAKRHPFPAHAGEKKARFVNGSILDPILRLNPHIRPTTSENK